MSEETGSEAAPAASSGRARRSLLLAVLLALAATAWVLSGVVTETPSVDGDAAAEVDTDATAPIKVRVAEIDARERARTLVVTGRTNAIKDAEIKAETSGNVIARPARKGSIVEKGTVLVRLAMDDRQARLADAEARVDAAQLIFDAAKDLQRRQFESEVRLAESKAELAAAKAALAAIELDIERTRIRAPIDGFIETLLPGPGDYVDAGEMVAMVVDLDPIRVIAHVTERDVADVTVDDLATVRLPNGREVGGTVHYVSRVANEATRTFRVDIWIDNPDAAIPAGLTAEVELNAGAQMAHMVPSSALTLNDRGVLGVRTVDADNKVVFAPVRILADTPEGTWIAGLAGTVRLITVGQEFVVEGQEVQPTTDVVSGTEGGDAS